jgi:C4-dicarboxylate transporter DctM subunit
MVAGNLMETGGISRRLINFCNALLGSLTGGLAMVAFWHVSSLPP